MRIFSWNVAGLRACFQKGLPDFFSSVDPDIFCIQESKVLEEQNPFHVEGYEEYLYPAVKKGYSGTLVYTRIKPISVKYGIDVEEYDNEGRTITLEYDDFYLVNCYVPNTKRGLERMDSRMEFEEHIKKYLNDLRNKKNVIYCGDLNVAHQEIDLKNPASNRRNAGFTDEERNKMTELLETGFIDTFRHLYPDTIKYTWWSYFANSRANNTGWRIDYFLVNEEFMDRVKEHIIHDQVMGSDHCPIELQLDM